MTDFAATIAAALTAAGVDFAGETEAHLAVLSAALPELCPHRSSDTPCLSCGGHVHACPDCPAIAHLLAIGAAVMAGVGAPSLQELGWTFEDGWSAAIAHLRAVQP